MDPKIIEAVEEAVKEEEQSEGLARRLVAWFGAISSGNEDINDRQSANRHLEVLYEEARLPSQYNESDSELSLDESLESQEMEL